MPEEKAEKVQPFVRNATGLRKNVTLLDAISMNIGVMSIGPTLATIGLTLTLLTSVSGINLVYASLISAVLVIPLLTIYTMLGRRISRTGGDYVWVSRAFGGLVGAPAAFVGFVITTMAFSAFTILSIVFAVGSIGVFFGHNSLLGLSLPGNVTGANPTEQLALGVVIFVVLVIINAVNAKIGYRLATVFTIFSILTILLAYIVLLSAGRGGVVSYMNTFGNSNLTYSAVSSSYTGPSFSLSATIFILPFFAIFVYPYLNNPPAVGSELKGNAAKWNAPIAVLIVAIILTAGFAVLYYVAGLPFINAAFSNPTLVFDYSFNFFTLAMGVSSNSAIAWVIGLGWIVSWMVVLQVNMLAQPRYLFSMAFDRFLPSRLADVSERFATPIYGLLAYAIPTIIVLGLATYLYGTVVSLFGAVAATMVYFIILGGAGIKFGLKESNSRSKAILVLAGILTMIIFGYITYQFFAYPSVWGGNPLAYGFLAVGLVFAVAAYLISKAIHRREGVDISLAYKEIPPE
jgi:amino acid transporter